MKIIKTLPLSTVVISLLNLNIFSKAQFPSKLPFDAAAICCTRGIAFYFTSASSSWYYSPPHL